jgi:hypothetical protein
MALTADRNTPERAGDLVVYDVAAATTIYAGALVMLDASGNIVPGDEATGQIAAGRAEEQVDNSGGLAGDLKVKVKKGVFRFKNSASTDAIAKAQIGDTSYIVDDETVAKTDGSASRSAAGKIVDVDAQGVWVLIS